MDKVQVSIIIPAYNVENYIEECIDSVLRQDLKNYEIIVVNDGSTDNTGKILEKYNHIKNIKIIFQENAGAGAARNIGLRLSKGKYIMFLDGDDLFTENSITFLLTKIQNENLDILTFNYLVLKENKILKNISNISENKILDGQSFLKESLKVRESILMPWINIYNKEFLLKNNLFFNNEMRSEEDCEFYIKFILRVKKALFIDIPMVIYRDTPKSLSKKRKGKKENYLILLNTYLDEIINIRDPELKKLIYNYMAYIVKNIVFEEIKFKEFELFKKHKKIFLDVIRRSKDFKYKIILRIIVKMMSFFI